MKGNIFQSSVSIYHILHYQWKKINRGVGLGLEIPVMYQARESGDIYVDQRLIRGSMSVRESSRFIHFT